MVVEGNTLALAGGEIAVANPRSRSNFDLALSLDVVDAQYNLLAKHDGMLIWSIANSWKQDALISCSSQFFIPDSVFNWNASVDLMHENNEYFLRATKTKYSERGSNEGEDNNDFYMIGMGGVQLKSWNTW